MARRFVSSVVLLLLLCERAFAGWYHVENYEGFLGPYPIHFSIQTYDSFGSGITAEGSYFYDAKRSPIAIYGQISGARLVLCEISDDKDFDRIIRVGSKTPVDTAGCPFALDIDKRGATGTWIKGKDKYPVILKKVAGLDDTGAGKIDGTVAIPFWAQTRTHMFSGLYTNTASGICMEKMQIVDKKSSKVDQEIVFDKDDDSCEAGMLMTPIYLNVEKQMEAGVGIISVNFADGRAGYTMDYKFNASTRKYQQEKQ